MKYEMPSFRVDKTDFLKGNNSYDDYPDGGVTSSTVGVNAFSKPGLITQAPQLGNSVTAGLPQNGVVSWALGYGASSPIIFATTIFGSNQGKWYTANSSTGDLTPLTGYDSTGGRTYQIGITDTVFYNAKMYTSATDDIVEQNIDGTSRLLTFWTTTKGKAALTSGIPHPLLVYESILYIADGRYLHKLDGITASTQVFDLPPNFVITAMVEFNGLIYVTAEPYINNNGVIHGGSFMFSWDGTTDSWFEQYYINYRVNAMYVYKNRLFMWTNKFMGQWDGSKIVPLKAVSNQVFKCHITETSDSLVYADGTILVRFGAPFIPGAVERFYSYLNSGLGNNWTGIISTQDNNLIAVETALGPAINTSEAKNYYISNLNTATTSGARSFTFNTRFFNKPVKVRRVVVELDRPLRFQDKVYPWFYNDTASGNDIQPAYKSGVVTGTDSAMINKTVFDFDYGKIETTRFIQPRLYVFGDVHVRSIDYFYEAAENNLHKI